MNFFNAREALKAQNPGAYRQMLEIEESERTTWKCMGAAQRYVELMLQPIEAHADSMGRVRRQGAQALAKGAARRKVEAMFLSSEAIYSFNEMKQLTGLTRSTLSNVLFRLRKEGRVRYAAGSKRGKPIYCHPQHPQALGITSP